MVTSGGGRLGQVTCSFLGATAPAGNIEFLDARALVLACR